MATEKRLIDGNKAQAVLVNMAEHLLEAGNPEMAGAVGYAAEVIGKQPTVDAVEVVRCKECKCAYINSFSAASGVAVCKHWSNEAKTAIVQQDDFCSCGERREGE